MSAARATAMALAEHPRRPRTVLVLGGPGLTREIRDAGLRAVAASPAGSRGRPRRGGRRGRLLAHLPAAVHHRGGGPPGHPVRGHQPRPGLSHGRGAGRWGGFHRRRGGRWPVVASRTSSSASPSRGCSGRRRRSWACRSRRPSSSATGWAPISRRRIAVGARSVLMLTGVSTRAHVDALPADARPTWVAEDAAELARLLDGLGG